MLHTKQLINQLSSNFSNLSYLNKFLPFCLSNRSTFQTWQPPSSTTASGVDVRILDIETIVKYQNKILPPRADYIPPLEPRTLTPEARRCGLIAVKIGPVFLWNNWSSRVVYTVLWVDECEVTQVCLKEFDGRTSLQLGAGWMSDTKLHPRRSGHFRAQNVPGKRILAEFAVSRDALMPTGTPVNASHFVAGQHVDVTGITIGYGFQGVVKRWGFGGGQASRYKSAHFRKPGAIGAQGMHSLVKGRKMAGQTGGVKYTKEGLLVYKVDAARNLIYVRGRVPGNHGNYVLVRDSPKSKEEYSAQRPFPTYLGDTVPPVSTYSSKNDDYDLYRADT